MDDKRRTMLEDIERGSLTAALWHWPPKTRDWAAHLFFAERLDLSEAHYRHLHALGQWHVNIALCLNRSVSELLIRQMADIAPEDPVPSRMDDFLEEKDGRKIYDPAAIRYIARDALRRRG